MTILTHRLATIADEAALSALMTLAIERLQSAYLTPDQVAASHAFMGLDSRLIADGTYFVIEDAGVIAGCGGWSRRATSYGGNHSAGRDDRLLDPATEAARVRAMYTHPDHARKGVGTLILSLCEAAARAEGFGSLELSGTMAGVPLYRSFGFEGVRAFEDSGVPMLLMRKVIGPARRGW
ncbi:MAG: GNAT family N-acetyltransferase [Sphingobium sp.]|nr:GNAT family N-acetyltransferase [Sphingobium sp.]